MRKFWIAFLAVAAVAFSGQAMAHQTRCAKKPPAKQSHSGHHGAHWGKHHHHGIHLEGSH